MGNYAYLLLCSDGSYYSGWTNDPEKREKAHNSGRGSRCTRSRLAGQDGLLRGMRRQDISHEERG